MMNGGPRKMVDEVGGRRPKDLSVRTKEFALRVIRLYSSLSSATAAQVLGKQVLRSGTSVGANYREANRARSTAEFVAKIGDCLKELDETAYWLELLVESSLMPTAKVADLRDECDQLLAIFTAIAKKSKSRAS
jgi:four helix bundle protein